MLGYIEMSLKFKMTSDANRTGELSRWFFLHFAPSLIKILVDLTNKEGMYERILDWKYKSFKALNATMTAVATIDSCVIR